MSTTCDPWVLIFRRNGQYPVELFDTVNTSTRIPQTAREFHDDGAFRPKAQTTATRVHALALTWRHLFLFCSRRPIVRGDRLRPSILFDSVQPCTTNWGICTRERSGLALMRWIYYSVVLLQYNTNSYDIYIMLEQEHYEKYGIRMHWTAVRVGRAVQCDDTLSKDPAAVRTAHGQSIGCSRRPEGL